MRRVLLAEIECDRCHKVEKITDALDDFRDGSFDLCADCATEAEKAQLYRLKIEPAEGIHPMPVIVNAADGAPGHFGLCPECERCDGYIDIGRGHWFFCREHKTRWFAGSNLLSTWRLTTEDEQRAIYDHLGFADFRDVEPVEARAA